MTKVLIFDFDGTIADTMAFASEIANDILPDFSKKKSIDAADIQKLREMTIPQALRYVQIPAYRLPRMAIVAKQELTKRIDELKPIDGIVEVIKKLSDEGVEMGIVTSNSRKNVMTFLRKYDLKHCFSFVEAGASIFGKSRNIRSTMRKQRIEKSNCIYIGDEIRDIDASRAVKIDCLSVAWGLNSREILTRLNPGAVIDKPSQLIKAVITR